MSKKYNVQCKDVKNVIEYDLSSLVWWTNEKLLIEISWNSILFKK